MFLPKMIEKSSSEIQMNVVNSYNYLIIRLNSYVSHQTIFAHERIIELFNFCFIINSSINELVDCSENAARKICGNDAAKFTRELVDKYANSLTKVSLDCNKKQ